MSKKIAKILGGLAAVGAATAGVFFWYKKKSETDFEDEFNEDFEAEEFELDEDLKEVSDRGYTTLTPSAEAETTEEAAVAEEAKAEEAVAEEAKACECTCGCCCEESKAEECCCEEEASAEPTAE